MKNKVDFRDIFNKFGWLIALAAAITISTISLYFVGKHYGLPDYAAWLTSACFDGAAIVTANQAISAAERRESSIGPRMWVLVFAGASSYFNSQHAYILGGSTEARVFFALPPIVAVVVYERHIRDVSMAAQKRSGRLRLEIPHFEKSVWVLFPVRTIRIMRNTIGSELSVFEGDYVARVTDASSATIRLWAETQGIEVKASGPVPSSVVRAFIANSPRVPATPNTTTVSASNGATGGFQIKDMT